MACVYPTREPDAARKTPTLQDISNNLKRLETLLSNFVEKSAATRGSAGDDNGRDGHLERAQSEFQIQARPGANDNAIKSVGQHPSDKPSNKSTWEILLNNSDIEPLLQDVSLDFLSRLFRFSAVLIPREHT
jgi:hypothetical protein